MDHHQAVQKIKQVPTFFFIFALIMGLILIAMPVPAARAATPIYVNAATGDDAWDGEAAAWDGAHGPKKTIQAGIDVVDAGGVVNVAAGTYTDTLNIDTVAGLTVNGADKNTVIVQPDATLCWNVGGYGCARQAAVRVVSSTNIVLQNMTLDFATIAGNNVIGVFYWDSTGTVDNCILENMSLPDASGYYYEITSYIRAPSYTDAARAAVSFTNNTFFDTGRLGMVTHQYVDMTITGNTFYKTTNDFGYAIELGSESVGTISGNTIYGYDTPAASDGSNSAGIYVENSFTWASPSMTKNVSLTSNEIYDCQWALYIGNEFDGYAGDVDMALTISNNDFHDNIDGAVILTDEDRSAGSSVNATFQNNTLANNGDFGYFIYTWGDGDVTASLTSETVTGHDVGLYVNDYAAAPPTGSVYNVTVHYSYFCGNISYAAQNDYAGLTIDAENNWWGGNYGPGNTGPGCLVAPNGISGTIDADPWLMLDFTADPTTVVVNATASLSSTLTYNSDSADTSGGGAIADGTTVTFDGGALGSVAPAAPGTTAGLATSTFTAGSSAGYTTASATVCGQTVTQTITILDPTGVTLASFRGSANDVSLQIPVLGAVLAGAMTGVYLWLRQRKRAV